MQKTKDRAKIPKGQKDKQRLPKQKVKQRSTKHYAENKRSSKDTLWYLCSINDLQSTMQKTKDRAKIPKGQKVKQRSTKCFVDR